MSIADLDTRAPVLDADAAVEAAARISADLAAGAAERDAQRLLPAAQIDALSASGLLGITVPAAYGGPDLSASTVAEVFRLLAVGDPNVAQIPHSHFVYVNALRHQGTTAQKSFFFAKYRVRGDRLEVRKVDSAKAARLVIDGRLDGTVKKGRNDLHVYVRGGRQQMLDLVRGNDLFESKPSLVFTRSRQELQDFERSLQHAAQTPAAQEPRR